ncbi:MAG: DUF192 domain-containing protein [Planctomycetota bacterium]|jgi:uncharacterized membrane protein (UPF0127 family)
MVAGRTLLLVAIWYAVVNASGCADGSGQQSETVPIAGERFTLELAADDASRTRGLMGRRDISPDGGMLFIFPRPAVRSFWMADCVVDIDIVFLDPQGRVTATHRMKVEAPRRLNESEIEYLSRLAGYSSIYPAQFAIELRAGTLDRLSLRLDDKIEMDLRRLKAMAK